jgi:solute carrier family 25 (mitochondrial carnitine/acylcarnitine transporter), member 20/29
VRLSSAQPLDTIKTRMQSIHTRNQYSGTFSALSTMVRREGWRALFRGLGPPLAGNAPLNAVMFAAYGNAMRTLDSALGPDPPGETSHLKVTLAGAWGGFLQCFVTTPTELIKCRQQVVQTAGHTPSMLETARVVIREDGLVRGMYRGLAATIARDVPSFAAYFWAYEKTKDWLTAWANRPSMPHPHPRLDDAVEDPVYGGARRKSPVWVLLVAGSVAGVATWVSCYPIDVVKTAQQTMPANTPKSQMSALAVSRSIYLSEGVRGFFRGISPTVIRAIPSNAVTFLVYEWCLEGLGQPTR